VQPREAASSARRAARVLRSRGNEEWALRAEALAFEAEVRRKLDSPGTRTIAWWSATRERAADLEQRLGARGLASERSDVALHRALAAVRTPGVGTVRVRPPPQGVEEPVGSRLLREEVRARAAWQGGRRADSLELIRRGLADLHGWQSSYGSLDLQSSLVGHGRSLARLGLDLAVEDGRPAVVHEWSERARALVARVPPVRPPADPDAADRLTALRTLPPGTSPEERARLRERVREDAWYRPGAGTVLEPLDLDEVLDRLGGDALVSYLVAHGKLHALVVTAERVEVLRLAPLARVDGLLPGLAADLDMTAVSDLPPAIRTQVTRGLAARLSDLATVLVAPLRGVLGDRRLVIVPAGRLAGVPWSMLPGLVGRPLTVARSASLWADAPAATPLATSGLVAGPDVPRAAQEVCECASAWGDRARVLTGTAADAATVALLTADVDVLHVAAHGHHADEHPLFSGLALVDGTWFGYDVELLPSLPSLVVLSACEVGRSTVRWAEELVGMTAAWQHAGARCVIAAPAAVNDELAGATLPALHRGLAGGRAPADVLAELAPTEGLPLTCFGAGW